MISAFRRRPFRAANEQKSITVEASRERKLASDNNGEGEGREGGRKLISNRTRRIELYGRRHLTGKKRDIRVALEKAIYKKKKKKNIG